MNLWLLNTFTTWELALVSLFDGFHKTKVDVRTEAGAFLTLGFTFLFGVKDFRLHGAMAIAMAILIGFNLLVALELDYPFSGQVRVSPAPYSTGDLAEFAGVK